MIALERRLEVLERSVSGACPKCAGVHTTFVCEELRVAMRNGQPLGAKERAEFEAARPRCPECGAGFLEVRVPPPGPHNP